jgi:hypothetical protein
VTTRAITPPLRTALIANLEGALLAAAAASVVFLLQWHYGFNWSDEGWLWYISQRTSLGQVPVRDVFSYDPGRYYWSAAIFKLLGGRGFFEQLVASYLFGIVGLAVAYIALVRAGVPRGWRIALLILLALVLGYPRHKVYEQTLSLLCASGITYVLSAPEKLKRWFLYGFATGLAAFIGRNSGLYFAFAGLLALAYLKSVGARIPALHTLGTWLGGIALGYSPIFFMMIFVHGFAPAFVRSVLLTPRWSWPLPIPFPWASHIRRLHGLDKLQRFAVSWLCIAVPVSYAITVWKGLRTRPSGPQLLALGATFAGIGYLHHGFYHADFGHISQAVGPFVLVAGAVCSTLWIGGERRRALLYFAAGYLLILLCWLPSEPLVMHFRGKVLSDPGPVAEIEMYGKKFEVYAEQAQVMNAVQGMFRACGDRDGSFFEAPYYPGLYAFLGTRSPSWDVYYLWPRSEQVQKQEIESLEQNRTSLVLMNRVASFDRPTWLTIDSTNPLLPKYIEEHYQRIPMELPVNFEIDVLPGSCGVGPK